MRKLKIELESASGEGFESALEYAIEKLRAGYSSVDLTSEEVEGSCEVEVYE